MSAQILGKEGKYVTVRLASGEVRKLLSVCRATVGVVGNEDHGLVNYGKAGRMRWKGVRPTEQKDFLKIFFGEVHLLLIK